MAFQILSLILAGILSLADYVTEHTFSKTLRNNQKLISFSSGVAIAYIILYLFPEIASNALIDGRKLFLFVLIGFVALNLIEQLIYKKTAKIKNISAYHKNVHITYFFIYNMAIGILLVNFATQGLSRTLLFFIPFLLYITAEILPQEFEIKGDMSKVLYSMAPVFGAVAGIYYIDFAASIFGMLVSFITGTLLYIVIKESLPSNEAEKPLYFIIGAAFYAVIIILSWNF